MEERINKSIIYSKVDNNFIYDTIWFKTNKKVISYLENVKKKDIFTYNHIVNVYRIFYQYGKYKNYTQKQLECIMYISLYHDAGKLKISNDILNKRSSLNDIEWEVMKKHPILGLEFLDDIPIEYREEVSDAMYNHHYIKGYPKNCNDKPTFLTRMLSIIDVYEACSSIRPYKKSFSFEQTMDIIKKDFQEKDFIVYNEFIKFIHLSKTNKKLCYY